MQITNEHSIDHNKIIFRLLLVFSIIIVLLPQLYLYSHTSDDAYITYRYATRFASGQGLTFNPGEHVEGFSNPLWVLLIAGFVTVFHIDAPIVGHLLGLLLSIGTIIIIWQLICNNSDNLSDGMIKFVICMAIVLINPGFHVYATAGLEGPLVMFLITLGIFLTLENKKSALILAAIMFGLMGISRPEGLLYVLLWYFFAIRLGNKSEYSFKFEFGLIITLLLPLAFYEIFRVFYFNALLPNTGLAKLPGVYGSGMIYIIAYFFAWILSLIPFMLLSFVKVERKNKYKNIFRICFGPVLAAIIFVVYAQSDWMPFGRFITPIWPLVAILLTYWIHPILKKINKHFVYKSIKPTYPIILFTIILSSFFAWKPQIIAYIRNERLNMLMRGDDQLAVGEWLSINVRNGTTVATLRLGGISYAAPDLVFWDIFGLTDREEAMFISQKRPGGFKNDPIWNRAPEIIAAVYVPADWSYTKDEEYLNWLRSNYSFVRSFPQGNFGSFDIWVKKDAKSVLLFTY